MSSLNEDDIHVIKTIFSDKKSEKVQILTMKFESVKSIKVVYKHVGCIIKSTIDARSEMSPTAMIEVEIDSIRASLMNQHRIVILKDLHSERFLPIFIGQVEADAITTELQAAQRERPLTHDLLKSVISEMGGRLAYVLINDIRKETFYARLVIEVQGKKMDVDARPSDAIALAVRTKAPLFVTEAVMDKCAVEPEEDIYSQAGPMTSREDRPNVEGARIERTAPDIVPHDKIDESKLSAFADFLNTLNLDELDDEDRRQ
jgi:bifunctional DNase/RNase